METLELPPDAPGLPARLLRLHQPPNHLYVRGALPPLPGIAVVGTRKMTPYGQACADLLVPAIVRLGIAVVSGLALGIDGAAHEAALRAGGRTLAVLGSGTDDDALYPRAHLGLARRMLAEGNTLLSEYPPGTRARQHHFPQRNRLTAALSLAVLVIEAPERSGALITARLALEDGIDVWAVPGPITSPQSRGPNLLIRDGATPILGPDDIALALGRESAQLPLPEMLPDERSAWEILSRGPASADELGIALKADPAALSGLLTRLELKGLIRSLGGNRYSLYS